MGFAGLTEVPDSLFALLLGLYFLGVGVVCVFATEWLQQFARRRRERSRLRWPFANSVDSPAYRSTARAWGWAAIAAGVFALYVALTLSRAGR